MRHPSILTMVIQGRLSLKMQLETYVLKMMVKKCIFTLKIK